MSYIKDVEYEVVETGVVKIQLKVDLELIKQELISRNNEYYNANRELLQNIIYKTSDKLCESFLLNHTNEVLSLIDKSHVANLVTLKALKKLNNEDCK